MVRKLYPIRISMTQVTGYTREIINEGLASQTMRTCTGTAVQAYTVVPENSAFRSVSASSLIINPRRPWAARGVIVVCLFVCL